MAILQIDNRQWREAEQRLAGIKNGLNRAAARAINRTLTTGQTMVVREIAANVRLPQRRIRQLITVRKADAGQDVPSGRIVIKNQPVPLIDFGARQSKSGVTVRPYGSGGKARRIPGAFIASMANGHRGVFWRARGVTHGRTTVNPTTNKLRISKGGIGPSGLSWGLPIKELFGPSILRVYKSAPGLVQRVLSDLSATLAKNLNHEIAFLLRKGKP